jgi:FkbM family methyltransferase
MLLSRTREFAAELDRWIGEAAVDLGIRSASARSSVGVDAGWRPALFGAGALGRVVARGLRRSGREPLCFVDNDPRRWGSAVEGLAVISLAEATGRFGRNIPIVVTIYTGAGVEAQLREAGYSVITYPQLALMFPAGLLPWAALESPVHMVPNRARIHEALSVWDDDPSREEFVAQIRFRATFAGPMPPHLPAQATYFPEELVSLKPDEVFVDCGAFDGDSVSWFLRRSGGWFREVVAIEPDPASSERLRRFVSGLADTAAAKIKVVEAALGATNGTVHFQATGTWASRAVDGQGTIEVSRKTLDDILRDCAPSYIKMDLEGAEVEAIAGAREIIQRHAPVMAICLYHRQSDLWEIPLQIRHMTDQYSFFLRRYSDDCWEQVLYVIPRERVRIGSGA